MMRLFLLLALLSVAATKQHDNLCLHEVTIQREFVDNKYSASLLSFKVEIKLHVIEKLYSSDGKFIYSTEYDVNKSGYEDKSNIKDFLFKIFGVDQVAITIANQSAIGTSNAEQVPDHFKMGHKDDDKVSRYLVLSDQTRELSYLDRGYSCDMTKEMKNIVYKDSRIETSVMSLGRGMKVLLGDNSTFNLNKNTTVKRKYSATEISQLYDKYNFGRFFKTKAI